MTAVPYRYYLTLHVTPTADTASVYVSLWDEAGVFLAEVEGHLALFCTTWQDVAQHVEEVWLAHGGQLPPLSRPSPYVALC